MDFRGLGRTSEDLEGLQRTWKDFRGLGRTSKDLEGLQRTWKDFRGLGRTSEDFLKKDFFSQIVASLEIEYRPYISIRTYAVRSGPRRAGFENISGSHVAYVACFRRCCFAWRYMASTFSLEVIVAIFWPVIFQSSSQLAKDLVACAIASIHFISFGLTKFCNKSSFNGIGLDRLYTIWRKLVRSQPQECCRKWTKFEASIDALKNR
jgi:hypothetical protein